MFLQCGRVPPGRKAPTKMSQVREWKKGPEKGRIQSKVIFRKETGQEGRAVRQQTLDNSRRLSTRRRRWRSTSKEASTRGSKVMWATLIGYQSRVGSTVVSTRVGGNQGLSTSNRESEGMLGR